MINNLKILKKFILLSNNYYNKLQNGTSLSELIEKLDDEEVIYLNSKDEDFSDLKEFTKFKEDYEIEDNWYALAKAYVDFYKTKNVDNPIINSYILKMINR